MRTSSLLLALLVLLTGCAATQNRDYAAYLAATSAASSKAADPIIRIKASPGQVIEFRGVETFEVYAPGGNATASIATPPAAQPHPAWSIVSQTLGLAGAVLPSYFAGKAAQGLANVVGRNDAAIAGAGFNSATSIAGAGFSSASGIAASGFGAAGGIAALIQAPAPNITLSGTGVIGGGTNVGANSGASSGNAGTLGNENASPKPVTTTTTTTTTANRTCSGSSGTTGGGSATC